MLFIFKKNFEIAEERNIALLIQLKENQKTFSCATQAVNVS